MDAITLLKTAKLKTTPTRLAILDLFIANSKNLLCAKDVSKFLSDQDMSTIYRTLDTFFEKSILSQAALIDSDCKYYQLNVHTHHHYIVCKSCNRKFTLSFCPITALQQQLAKDSDFTITDHEINLSGYCSKCK